MRVYRVVGLLAVLLFGALLAQNGWAQLPMKDDFSGGGQLPWEISQGTWEFTDDQLVATNFEGNAGGIILLPDVGTDLLLSVDVTLKQVQPTGALRVGLVAHSNGGVGADKAWRFIWGNKVEQPPANLIFLEELVAWRKNAPDVKMELDKTYTMKMEVKGNTARGKVWLKGTAEPDWQIIDSGFTSDQLDQAWVGLVAAGADVVFDNFAAEELPQTATGTLSGTVVNQKDGKPMENASVEAVGPEPKTVTTGPDGTFSMDVEAGTYDVTARAFGFPAVVQKGVQVTGGGSVKADFQLVPGTRVAATLSVKDGKPVLNGLRPVFTDPNGDGLISYTTALGKEVIRTGPTEQPADDIFLYIEVDDNFLFGGLSTGTAYVTMEYLDQGEGSFGLNYDSGPAFPDAQFKNAPGDLRADSGDFKTYTWTLTDASFSNREQNVADFRIFDGGGSDDNDLYISRVIVSTVPFEEIPPDQLEPPAPGVRGDVDGNGQFTIVDVVTSLQAVAGLKTLTPAQQTAADVNKNGKADITDVVLMLRKLAGLIPDFPA